MASAKASRPKLVRAAGAVIVRGEFPDIEVLVVHRPRYDDWSHPKGKCDKGEKYRDACLREVLEETGLHVDLHDRLQTVKYKDAQKRPKKVKYWLATPDGDGTITRAPDKEVDKVEWISLARARSRLTSRSDRRLLEEAVEALR